jgi:hypothetical protein
VRAALAVVACLGLACGGGASEIRTLKLAGNTLLVHPFEGDVPLPWESDWSVCTSAGPAFVPEDKSIRVHWIVFLEPKAGRSELWNVESVLMDEVSGESEVSLFRGAPLRREGSLMIDAPGQLLAREIHGWAYDPKPSLFVLRLRLIAKSGKEDLVMQPVYLGTEVKQQLAEHLLRYGG